MADPGGKPAQLGQAAQLGPTAPQGPSAQDGKTAQLGQLDTAVAEAAPLPQPSAAHLPTVERSAYDIEGELARGGLGRVLKARDRRLGRPVAIKELLSGEGDSSGRFLREALLTARLQHPSIVPIYEAGRWPDGSPFYAMRKVTGRSLEEMVASARNLDGRLALLPSIVSVVDAVAYAHSQRIIHRDLKPANIIIGSFGETVVIDWGLAKELLSAEPERTTLPSGRRPSRDVAPGATIAGAVLGTPAFMAPEQAAARPVDERADVYALGAMIYFVLCGEAPADGVNTEEILTKVIHGRLVPIGERAPRAPRELCAIVDKAMALDPADRYRTALDLGADLRSFQQGRLVRAHRYTPLGLAERWLRRNRANMVVGVVTVLVAAIAVSAWVGGIKRERDGAARDRDEVLAQLNDAILGSEALATRADGFLMREGRAASERDPAAVFDALKDMTSGSLQWPAARVVASGARARWGKEQVLRRLAGGKGKATLAIISPRTGEVAIGGDDGGIRLLRLTTAEAGPALAGHQGAVTALDYSSHGVMLASGGADGTVRLWGLQDGGAAPVGTNLARTGSPIRWLAFSRDDKQLAYAASGGEIGLCDLGTGQCGAPRLHGGGLTSATWSRDGKLVASAGQDGVLHLWPMPSGDARKLEGQAGPLNRVIFSRDGRTVVSAASDGSVWVRPTAGGEPRILHAGNRPVRDALYLPDGLLATAGDDGAIRVWGAGVEPTRILRTPRTSVLALAWSGDDRTLLSVGGDGRLRQWEPGLGETAVILADAQPHLALSPEGRIVAVPTREGTVALWSNDLPRDPTALRAWLSDAAKR